MLSPNLLEALRALLARPPAQDSVVALPRQPMAQRRVSPWSTSGLARLRQAAVGPALQAGPSAHAPPLLRHAPARSRGRPAHDSASARPWRSEATTVYLHLSHRHLQATASPLDALSLDKQRPRQSSMDRPPLEVADVIRAAGRPSSITPAGVSTGSTGRH